MKKMFISFLDGIGDLFSVFPPPCKNPYEKSDDSMKLQQDWNNVGKDLEKSFHLAFSGKGHGYQAKRIKAH